MKKILLFIILLLFSLKVNAQTYYSDYGEYSEYTLDKPNASDIVAAYEQKRYQMYEKVEEYDYKDDTYSGIKTGNKKEIFSDWVTDIELLNQSKDIERCYEYERISIKKYKYIFVKNNGEDLLKIDKFLIKDKNSLSNLYDISNVLLYSSDIYVLSVDNLNLDYMSLSLEISKNDHSNAAIDVSLYLTNSFPLYGSSDLVESFFDDKIEFKIDDFHNYTNLYDESNSYSDCFDSLDDNINLYQTYYRNKSYLYEYKIEKRNYIDEYSVEPSLGYDLDYDKYITYYRYKKRDKTIITDNIIIDSKDKNLYDYIEFSTIDKQNITINTDIDYSNNAIYNIDFILPYQTISKEVLVDIEEDNTNTKVDVEEDDINTEEVEEDNQIDDINNSNEENKNNESINVSNEINDLNSSLINANYLVDKKNREIKEVIKEEENKINDLNDQLKNCNIEKKNLEEQKISLKEEKNIKDQSFSYIYFLLLMIVLLITCRKKYLKKNS